MTESPRGFDLEKLKQDFEPLLATWKSHWSKIGNLSEGCPRWLHKRIEKYLTEGALEAQEPEQIAMHEVINFAAASISEAHKFDQQDETIDLIRNAITNTGLHAKEFYDTYLATAIFKKTLSLMQPKTQATTDVDEIAASVRKDTQA